MTTLETPPETPAVSALAGRYLTFALGAESYGLPVTRIREIIRHTAYTAIPRAAPGVKGVINLRGRVIPALDLRTRLGLPEIPPGERTCMIVALASAGEGASSLVALIVDRVEEVTPVSAADVQETPDFGRDNLPRALVGLARVRGSVKSLLDLDRLLGL